MTPLVAGTPGGCVLNVNELARGVSFWTDCVAFRHMTACMCPQIVVTDDHRRVVMAQGLRQVRPSLQEVTFL